MNLTDPFPRRAPADSSPPVDPVVPLQPMDPNLTTLAEAWRTYVGTTELTPRECRAQGVAYGTTRECLRCAACDEEIYSTEVNSVLHHLFLSHGYRRDGRQFDNHNQQIRTAAEHAHG